MPVLKAESRAQDQALEFLQWEDWKVRKKSSQSHRRNPENAPRQKEESVLRDMEFPDV